MNHKAFFHDNFSIINKQGQEVDFDLNAIQERYLLEDAKGRDIILKARQQGFSTVILARFTEDFLLTENSQSVIVADNSDNAVSLLERVKHFVKSYEQKNKIKVPLKYNSRYELHNEALNSKYTIGTAENTEFGRSRTITNLHLSEAAFYQHFEKILAGAGSAVVPDGQFIIETTANGFNEFKEFWDESVLGQTGFNPLFYKASDFYDQEYLDLEKRRLKRQYDQEYPDSALDAFLTSGLSFFDLQALKEYTETVREPLTYNLIY